MKTTAEILRGLPYFSDLPQDMLERVCDASEQVSLPEGQIIIHEGTDSEEMYVVIDGELVVTKRSADRDVELGRIGPGDVVGEIALLDQAPRTATVLAATQSDVIRVPVSAFEDLLSDSRVVRRMFRTVTSRLRGIEDTLRHEERMAALGKMAAQLMHELNNPAAAVSRSAQELQRLQTELEKQAHVLSRSLDVELPQAPMARSSQLSALEASDIEDEVADWLGQMGVETPWDIAPALVQRGWDKTSLEAAVAPMSEDIRPDLLRWAGLQAATEQVVGELGIGARRISELVRVVKEYSFLDRAPIQEVDITTGINDTLILLKHKLRSVDLEVDFAPDLQHVVAPGRDLNQVWTNLIDNAADAMPEGGRLEIRATNQGSEVVVEVSDNGTGMPDDIAERIFDPFFTTKEPGKGTGLGLHTVHTIVGRIGGQISVTSSPEGTTFQVRLPALTETD